MAAPGRDSGDQAREAHRTALDLLARREHSTRELQRKLIQRAYDQPVIEQVIGELQEQNLLSDERFAEAYARSRVSRLFGPLKIRAELMQRGVEEGLADASLEEYAERWAAMAGEWLARKARPPLDRKERGRLYRSGCARGFSHEQVMAALDLLKSTP